MTSPKDVADRLELEVFYDRASFHCGHAVCESIGRLSAILEQHCDRNHPPLSHFVWKDWCCNLCGFDAQEEFLRLYPSQP